MKLKIEIEGKILFKLLIISLSFKFSILFFFFVEKRFWERLNKSKNQNQNWTVEKSLEFGYLIFILFFFWLKDR